MTKAQLVSKIAATEGITRTQAGKAVDGLVSALSGALACGDKITIAGFGTFSVVSTSQPQGPGRRTDANTKAAASNVVEFKTGKMLSLRLARNEQNDRDLGVINRRAEFLNREVRDVLEYQAPLSNGANFTACLTPPDAIQRNPAYS